MPRDRNGEIIDVYEYVAGRPQLITTGVGSRDFTGGGELFSLLSDPQNIGLESVSADGTDVYFSTYESLVDQDVNGAFVKFYDARTGGGFPSEPDAAALRGGRRVPRRRQLAAAAADGRHRRQPRLRRQLRTEEGKKKKKHKKKGEEEEEQAQWSREAQPWLTSDG